MRVARERAGGGSGVAGRTQDMPVTAVTFMNAW